MKPRTILLGVMIWLVPMIVSMFMFDPETNSYLPNFPVFKSVMVLLILVLTFLVFNSVRKRGEVNWLSIATTYMIICSALDVLVMILLFGIPFSTWLMYVFPIYPLVFYGLGYLIIGRKQFSN